MLKSMMDIKCNIWTYLYELRNKKVQALSRARDSGFFRKVSKLLTGYITTFQETVFFAVTVYCFVARITMRDVMSHSAKPACLLLRCQLSGSLRNLEKIKNPM
jgi:hypothetical protein